MRSTSAPNTSAARPESFQLKGGLFPMTLLELKTVDLGVLAAELRARVTESPAFFQHTPVVLGFEQLKEDPDALNLIQLRDLCQQLGLIPTAIKGGNSEQEQQAYALGLAALPKGKAKGATTVETNTVPTSERRKASAQPEAAAPVTSNTQVIDTPVRSGQQIYVQGDLIVLSSVSAGAEILADGNIHVYGALRGRALAGLQGDETARVFCQSQEAELIAIAGHYLVDEDLRSQHWKAATQAYCVGGKLIIAPLS